MPHYCHQVSYTKEAWARLMADPQDRLDIVRTPIEKLGGKLHSAFFAFGPFDVIAITEMPDSMSAGGDRYRVCRRRCSSSRANDTADDIRAGHRGNAQSRYLRLQVRRSGARSCCWRLICRRSLKETPKGVEESGVPRLGSKPGLCVSAPHRARLSGRRSLP